MILPFTELGKNRLWGDIKSSVLHKRSLRYCWNIQVEITSRKQDVDMFVIIDCHLRFQGYQLSGCLGGRECRKGTRNCLGGREYRKGTRYWAQWLLPLQTRNPHLTCFLLLEPLLQLRTLSSHRGLEPQCPEPLAFSPFLLSAFQHRVLSNCKIFLLGILSESASRVFNQDQCFDLSFRF